MNIRKLLGKTSEKNFLLTFFQKKKKEKPLTFRQKFLKKLRSFIIFNNKFFNPNFIILLEKSFLIIIFTRFLLFFFLNSLDFSWINRPKKFI